MEFKFLGLQSEQWLNLGFSLLIVAAALILGRWVFRVLLGGISRWVIRRTRTTLDDAVLDALRLPLYWFGIVIAFQIALARLDFLPDTWDAYMGEIFYTLYLVVGLFCAWRLARNLFTWYGHEVTTHAEINTAEQLLPFFRRVAMIILGLVGIIILLRHFDVDVSALVATLGVGSLAIALAAQAALTDTISGFAIMIDRPFRIGDRIEIQELSTWGDVIDIGLRSSRIRTRDNRMVIIPNSVIGKSLIVNYSYPDTKYRIQINIGVAYGTDLELARQTMIDAVRDVEGVLPDQKVEALLLEFGPSALVFRVRWWLDSYADTRTMFDKVNTALYTALNEARIEIPNQQIDVYFKNSKDLAAAHLKE